MSIFGLGDDDNKTAKDDKVTVKQPVQDKEADSPTSQSDEAQAILKKMEEKKDAGDCAFC